jgi:RES domain-containing protein
VRSVWRIIQRQYAEAAFSGEGSAKYGGRWNQKGTVVVYCSQSESLAQLEVLVRILRAKDLALYLLIEARVPEELIETYRREDLPQDWNALPESKSTREIGTKWAIEKCSAVLGVPSVVVPTELDFLLNPEHPDFSKISLAETPIRPRAESPTRLPRLALGLDMAGFVH